MCRSCIIPYPEEPVEEIGFLPLKGKPFDEKELAEYILDLPRKPLFIGVDGYVPLSLAGVQDKAAICLIDNKPCILVDNSPTTHILKPAIEDIQDSIENEYLCLKIAKQVGISVPNAEMRHCK